MKLNKLGMIKGGVCEGIFTKRSERERGACMAIDWLLNHNCIEMCKGKYKIVKVPKKLDALRWVINNVWKLWGTDAEIGWRRMIIDIAIPLCKSGKEFSLKWLKKQADDLAAHEFALASTIRNKRITMDHIHYDSLYHKWRRQLRKKGE